jgi:hypothetical protein
MNGINAEIKKSAISIEMLAIVSSTPQNVSFDSVFIIPLNIKYGE